MFVGDKCSGEKSNKEEQGTLGMGGVAVLNRVVRKGLLENGAFE